MKVEAQTHPLLGTEESTKGLKYLNASRETLQLKSRLSKHQEIQLPDRNL